MLRRASNSTLKIFERKNRWHFGQNLERNDLIVKQEKNKTKNKNKDNKVKTGRSLARSADHLTEKSANKRQIGAEKEAKKTRQRENERTRDRKREKEMGGCGYCLGASCFHEIKRCIRVTRRVLAAVGPGGRCPRLQRPLKRTDGRIHRLKYFNLE